MYYLFSCRRWGSVLDERRIILFCYKTRVRRLDNVRQKEIVRGVSVRVCGG